jgi:serine/threonine protein kinase
VAAREILKGLNVLHDTSYIHRDIKPSNVILKDNGRLALCDFGSAVKCSQGQEYELEGFTRWYKAPEMLLGSRTYQY